MLLHPMISSLSQRMLVHRRPKYHRSQRRNRDLHLLLPLQSPRTLTLNVQLTIEGIEATQGTQFYKSSRHLHVPHAEYDNAVQLIKNRATQHRVGV